MKHDNSITLMGTTFKITYEAPECGSAGISNDALRYIKINPDMPADTQLETLYHEIVHMILRLSGLAEILGESLEESISQGVGHGLYRMAIDNPDGLSK